MPLHPHLDAAAITVDVEDWAQSTWDRSLPISAHAAENTQRLLDLLGELDIRVTLFVLGKFARSYPAVVRRMADEGHEVACHGDGHTEVFRQDPQQFRADVARAKGELEALIGSPVRGYRAPDFSIVRATLWALEVLAELGFTYDSSIYPIRSARYGIADWPQGPVTVRFAGGRQIVEFPLATVRFLGRNWPVAGGGYHRLLPGFLVRALARRVLHHRPFIFYCHPYEFDSREFARLDLDIPWRTRLHQGLGRRAFPSRFRTFARRFGGTTRLIDLCRPGAWPDRPATPGGSGSR